MANDKDQELLNEALLDLTTPTGRRNFKVDGVKYEFFNRDEFTLVQIRKIQNLSLKIDAKVGDDETAANHEAAITELIPIIVAGDAFAAIVPKLGYNQKKAIAETFLRLLIDGAVQQLRKRTTARPRSAPPIRSKRSRG